MPKKNHLFRRQTEFDERKPKFTRKHDSVHHGSPSHTPFHSNKGITYETIDFITVPRMGSTFSKRLSLNGDEKHLTPDELNEPPTLGRRLSRTLTDGRDDPAHRHRVPTFTRILQRVFDDADSDESDIDSFEFETDSEITDEDSSDEFNENIDQENTQLPFGAFDEFIFLGDSSEEYSGEEEEEEDDDDESNIDEYVEYNSDDEMSSENDEDWKHHKQERRGRTKPIITEIIDDEDENVHIDENKGKVKEVEHERNDYIIQEEEDDDVPLKMRRKVVREDEDNKSKAAKKSANDKEAKRKAKEKKSKAKEKEAKKVEEKEGKEEMEEKEKEKEKDEKGTKSSEAASMPKKAVKISPFQKNVYDAVRLIPSGKVTTYSSLAEFVGCSSAKAVLDALTLNPFPASLVPDHRVLLSSAQLGGYRGKRTLKQLKRKIKLLNAEGVEFEEESESEEEKEEQEQEQEEKNEEKEKEEEEEEEDSEVKNKGKKTESAEEAEEKRKEKERKKAFYKRHQEAERLFYLQVSNPEKVLFTFDSQKNEIDSNTLYNTASSENN
ncbi:putative 6-O-methylguanine DNA methyltransferase, DNA binding domain [Monocercomonoides exilis]|uniref:putative 6-O-methylguanine DNA methyltransferase, DNA binding domain n=1 Tax=Monocercomonoides exilis TaxID=2049356 RepID=UPI00355A695C|nr:putative 6-O-methylguanine DNA methyltransferase, DNA binding domain [Monocercomonoides exilis]|eukprot:MONOS_8580.1-p1 / transcript=MONOS_8580.1 / gene=MONOS_8580 / organism=Monocercomonoides_exilis_PA203 / gene_product=unspecified product / transcript_product=unspecified product / location=Mono_scaffold00327:8198-10664(+) / protein_length=551 / sequence_SO=supercontig / SO=protein_coding / is_pseudo=false